MQRKNRVPGNRTMIPIFGCRKRQRQAVYADPIDLPSNNEDDDILLNCNISQQAPMQLNQSIIHRNQPTINQSTTSFKHWTQWSAHPSYPGDRTGQATNKNASTGPCIPNGNQSKNIYSQQSFFRNDCPPSKNNDLPPSKNNDHPQSKNENNGSLINKSSFMHSTSRHEINRSINHQNDACRHGNRSTISQASKSQVDVPLPAKNAFVMKKKSNLIVRVITSSIHGIEAWSKFNDKIPIIFEICGTLDSTISYNRPDPQKIFTINDGSGRIRCMFWEIDRRLPQLSRGSTVRCIGKLTDQEYLHCFSVRSVKPGETRVLQKLIDKSSQTLQKDIMDSREI